MLLNLIKIKYDSAETPIVHSYYDYCGGFPHGCNVGPDYKNCWGHHLHNIVNGLRNSGEVRLVRGKILAS